MLLLPEAASVLPCITRSGIPCLSDPLPIALRTTSSTTSTEMKAAVLPKAHHLISTIALSYLELSDAHSHGGQQAQSTMSPELEEPSRKHCRTCLWAISQVPSDEICGSSHRRVQDMCSIAMMVCIPASNASLAPPRSMTLLQSRTSSVGNSHTRA